MENESHKQTAVDFIFSQLPDEYTTTRQGFEVYKHAKEIEKQQMWEYINKNYCIGPKSLEFHRLEFEQYFEEKYGKTFIDLVSDEESKVHEVVRKLKEKKN
jgi:hypothetical protein